MFLSIVIPAYNEEKRIRLTLENIHSFFRDKEYDYEVVLVDDGSTDMTKQIALSTYLDKAGKLKYICNERNRGKGFSVRRGIEISKGAYILMTDADMSTPITEFEKFLMHAKDGFDIVIGSRSINGADVRVHQPFYREYMGKIFNMLVRKFVFKGVVDTQCGFKLFKDNIAKNLAQLMKINGFAFDVEMLYLAKKKGYKIKESPVIWVNSFNSKVNPVFHSLKMFLELISIKRLHSQ